MKVCSSKGFLLVAVSIVTKCYSGTPYDSQGAETCPCQSGPFWHGGLQTSFTNIPKPSMCVFSRKDGVG